MASIHVSMVSNKVMPSFWVQCQLGLDSKGRKQGVLCHDLQASWNGWAAPAAADVQCQCSERLLLQFFCVYYSSLPLLGDVHANFFVPCRRNNSAAH